MMRRGLWLTLAALSVAVPAAANSRYSLRGVGEATFPQLAEDRSLGGTEAASSRPSITGNPANIAFVEKGTFHGSFETEWIRTKEPLTTGDLLRKDYVYLVPNLGLMFPMPGDFAMGLGITVDRRIGGRIEATALTNSGQDYLQIYEANGNVLKFPILVSYRRGNLAIGTGVDVLLRNDRLRWRNEFPDGVEFLDTNDIDKTSGWGAAWRTGVIQTLGPYGSVGGWLSLPSKLDGSRRLENEEVGDDPDDLKVDRTTEIAKQWSLGFNAHATDRLRIRGDWVHEAWSDVPPLSPLDEFVDVDRFAAGIEWATDPDERANWPLRVGFRTEQLHVLDTNGAKVRERVLTAGSGFGFSEGRGSLNWSVDVGFRGNESDNEFEERFVRFGMTLTGFETWARRRPVGQDDEDW